MKTPSLRNVGLRAAGRPAAFRNGQRRDAALGSQPSIVQGGADHENTDPEIYADEPAGVRVRTAPGVRPKWLDGSAGRSRAAAVRPTPLGLGAVARAWSCATAIRVRAAAHPELRCSAPRRREPMEAFPSRGKSCSAQIARSRSSWRTNFGLIFSEDGGETWLFSCEQRAQRLRGSVSARCAAFAAASSP